MDTSRLSTGRAYCSRGIRVDISRHAQAPRALLPHRTLDLLIHLGSAESFRIVNGQPAETLPPSSLTGMLLTPLVLEPAALFALPLHQVTGPAVGLEDLIGD